jgi:phosphate transport system permease protein
MAADSSRTPGSFPEGEASTHFVQGRQRNATLWATVFMASTMIGIFALTALLYNVVNSAFGFVMVQNEVDPHTIVLRVQREALLGAPNLTSSEDDEELAAGVAGSPYAVGFFGFAYVQEHLDTLRAVPVDGVEPSAATVEAGDYPLSRPLFVYTVQSVLDEKPQVGAFLDFYLGNVNGLIDEVGYFPVSDETLNAATATLSTAAGTPAMGDGVATDGDIDIAGSSTVYPLTQRMATEFKERGFGGTIRVEGGGTRTGIAALCNGDVDIANASRAITRAEIEACRNAKLTPIELRVGNDALAIVVSQENSFVQGVSEAELGQIFVTAGQWSDVNAAWPSESVVRYVPGAESGTLDFFLETALPSQLSELPKETLQTILSENVSAGLMRRFENDMPFAERSQQDVYELVLERVVNQSVIRSWKLVDSVLERDAIEAVVAATPNAELTFRSWINMDFVVSSQSPRPEFAGVRTAILGSLWVVLITILFSLPIGVGASVYLEEYAQDNRFNRLIETNINNLAGVPSIIYGMLGLAIFVRAMEGLTSGSIFGVGDPTTANGRTIFSAGLTLGLLILPLIIINSREAIRAVPRSLRQASYGLGATKWQTTWNHVLPSALPGILTGTILAVSRAIGETAPVVVIGASTFIIVDPDGPFSKFTTLPIQIYQWTSRPEDEFRNIAAAAILVLLIMLLSLNATAVILRNRFSTQRS